MKLPATEAVPARIAGSLEVPAGDGERLRLVFYRMEDRLGHAVWRVTADGQACLLARSLEGTDNESWPPSPPLQALHQQTLPDGRQAILLVGMAGRSHWSCSIEKPPLAAALRWDLACRHPDRPGWIGSTYQLADAAVAQLGVAALPGTAVERTGTALVARPVRIERQAGTVRWGYELHVRAASATGPSGDRSTGP